MVPFSHSELVKKCMISTIEMLLPNKPELKTAIEKVPLRQNTFTQRIEEIGEALTKSTLQDVMNFESFSLWLLMRRMTSEYCTTCCFCAVLFKRAVT